MSMWPKLTPNQRALLVRLDATPQGTLRYPVNRTYLRLHYEGMVTGETIISSFVTITQRGRDYICFGMRNNLRRVKRFS